MRKDGFVYLDIDFLTGKKKLKPGAGMKKYFFDFNKQLIKDVREALAK